MFSQGVKEYSGFLLLWKNLFSLSIIFALAALTAGINFLLFMVSPCIDYYLVTFGVSSVPMNFSQLWIFPHRKNDHVPESTIGLSNL